VAAIEAAQAMQQYNANWEPKEFDELAAEVKDDGNEGQEKTGTGEELSGFVYDSNSGKQFSDHWSVVMG